MGPDAVTIRTNHITLGDLGPQAFGRDPRLTSRVREGKGLDFPGPVVEIHHVGRVSLTTVGTGRALGLTEHAAVSRDPLRLKFSVVPLMLLVIATLVFPVTGSAPGLRPTALPQTKVRQVSLLTAPRATLHTS